MTKFELLEKLSELECTLYYAQEDIPGLENIPEIKEVHAHVRKALELYAAATGEHF